MRRRGLRGMSDRRRAHEAVAARAEREGAGAFRARIRDERCVVCGRSSQEAFKQTGFGHQAHHGIPRATLIRVGLGALVWDPENAVATCEEPCHRRHSSRHRRILRSQLPPRVIAFAKKHRLVLELEREYPE